MYTVASWSVVQDYTHVNKTYIISSGRGVRPLSSAHFINLVSVVALASFTCLNSVVIERSMSFLAFLCCFSIVIPLIANSIRSTQKDDLLAPYYDSTLHHLIYALLSSLDMVFFCPPPLRHSPLRVRALPALVAGAGLVGLTRLWGRVSVPSQQPLCWLLAQTSFVTAGTQTRLA
jgi:hypothetical protein